MIEWKDKHQAAHVVTQTAGADQFLRAARAAGAMIFELRLYDVVDEQELEELLKRTFRCPPKTAGFDPAIDLISNLDSMPSPAGYLLFAHGLDHCGRDVAEKVAAILPVILERCRTRGLTFVAVLVSDTSRKVVEAAISDVNDGLDEEAGWPTSVDTTGAVLVTYDQQPEADTGRPAGVGLLSRAVRAAQRRRRRDDSPARPVTASFELNRGMTDWHEPRQVVHVVAEFTASDQLIRQARDAGVMIFELQLDGMVDEDELEELLKRTFRFPHLTAGFDAAIDLMSDLEWMPSAAGYLLVVRGLDQCPPDVADTMAGIMPPILERCRTGGTTFVTVLVTDASRDVVAAALAEANEDLDNFAALHWTVNATGAVLVTYDR